MWGYLAVVALHVLAAMVWVGGTLFLALVGAPALRLVEPPSLRTSLFNAIGVRFRYVGWGAVALLLLTGVALVDLRGWLSADVLLHAAFWQTPVGTAFGWKLGFLVLMLVFSLIHDIAFDPRRALQGGEGATPNPAWRRRAMLLGRLGAVAAIAVVVAAVRLARA